MNCVCVHPPNSHSPHENRTPQSQTINHLRVERKKSLADLIQNNLSLKLENFSGEKELSSRAYKSSAENEEKKLNLCSTTNARITLKHSTRVTMAEKGLKSEKTQNEFEYFSHHEFTKPPGRRRVIVESF